MHKRTVLKMSINIYIKIPIAATCFGVITIIREPNMLACWCMSAVLFGAVQQTYTSKDLIIYAARPPD